MKLKKYQQEELAALLKIEVLENARSCILDFTCYRKPDYQVNWHHRRIANKLNDWLSGKIRFLMIFAPPRNGKSELVSRSLPAMIHGLYPNDEVMFFTYSDSLATDMAADVQKIMDSTEYKEVFPDVRIVAPDRKLPYAVRNANEHTLLNRQEKPYDGSYSAQGVGGAFTGKGANWLIGDDPIKGREAADSLAFREKLWKWYTGDARTRLEKGGQILLTFTRWHEDDLGGRIIESMKKEYGDQFEILTLPAIKETDEDAEDPREIGEALWPEKYPLPELLAMKALSERDFNSLQQQNPISGESSIIKKRMTVHRYDVLPKRFDTLCISADLRFKDDVNSGDYVVIDVWGRIGSKFYFVDQVRDRWGFNKSVEEFKKLVKKWPQARKKFVENKANGPALENVLKNSITGIILVEPGGSKAARVHAVEHLWEAGDVLLPTVDLFPEIDAVITEYTSFGAGGKFDDRVDTMTQALIKLEEGLDNSLAGVSSL